MTSDIWQYNNMIVENEKKKKEGSSELEPRGTETKKPATAKQKSHLVPLTIFLLLSNKIKP